mgnify:CR=1 FL=1
MGRFNLLDEPWISVLAESGEKKEVSMLDFFKNAGDFLQIAGEMETQNFAVMRFLLSVVQTVFSRFDYNGEELPGVVLDDNGRQTRMIVMNIVRVPQNAGKICIQEINSL